MAKLALLHTKNLSPDMGWNQQAIAYLRLDQARSSQNPPSFYDLNFIEDLLDCTLEILENSSLKGEKSWTTQLAAIFIYSKYSTDPGKTGRESLAFARTWAASVELHESWIGPLCETIQNYWLTPLSSDKPVLFSTDHLSPDHPSPDHPSRDHPSRDRSFPVQILPVQIFPVQILKDATLAVFARKRTLKRLPSLRSEKECARGSELSHEEWTDFLAEIFLKRHFETKAAAQLFDAKLKRNALNALSALERSTEDDDFGGEDTEKAFEIFFRIHFKNAMALTSIADHKANIMISVNSITMSIVIGSVMTNLDEHPNLKWPGLIMLIVNFITIVFSVIAARPSGKYKEGSKDGSKEGSKEYSKEYSKDMIGRTLFGKNSYPEFKRDVVKTVKSPNAL